LKSWDELSVYEFQQVEEAFLKKESKELGVTFETEKDYMKGYIADGMKEASASDFYTETLYDYYNKEYQQN
jgi:hypothetical protein